MPGAGAAQEGDAAGVALSQARLFQRQFVPKPGVDYGWLVTMAKERSAKIDAAAEYIDAKASFVINYFGGGVGVFAFLTAAGAASGAVSACVAAAALPAFAAGVGAVAEAVRVRDPVAVDPGPDIEWAAGLVGQYGEWAAADGDSAADPSRQAEYAMAGAWHVAATRNIYALSDKADRLSRAVRLKVWAVGLLLLPLVVAVAEKAVRPADAPKPVYVVIQPAP